VECVHFLYFDMRLSGKDLGMGQTKFFLYLFKLSTYTDSIVVIEYLQFH